MRARFLLLLAAATIAPAIAFAPPALADCNECDMNGCYCTTDNSCYDPASCLACGFGASSCPGQGGNGHPGDGIHYVDPIPMPAPTQGNATPAFFKSDFTPPAVTPTYYTNACVIQTACGFGYQYDGEGIVLGPAAASDLPVNRLGTSPRTPAAQAGTEPVGVDGEFVVDETDVRLPGYGLDFELRRHYRSGVDYQTSLGYGWNHNYALRLVDAGGTFDPNVCNGAMHDRIFVSETMEQTRFAFDHTDGVTDYYVTRAAGSTLTLSRSLSIYDALPWKIHDVATGLTYSFDAEYGDVGTIADLAKHVIGVAWDHSAWGRTGGVVSSVTDTTGRKIYFHYSGMGTATALDCLQLDVNGACATPLVRFRHAPNTRFGFDLVSVANPDGNGPTYVYGHPSILAVQPNRGHHPTSKQCGLRCNDTSTNDCHGQDVCLGNLEQRYVVPCEGMFSPQGAPTIGCPYYCLANFWDGQGPLNAAYDACNARATEFKAWQQQCVSDAVQRAKSELDAKYPQCRFDCLSHCVDEWKPYGTSEVELSHAITQVKDADGRVVVDNVYGTDPNLFGYGRVISHAQTTATHSAAVTMSFEYHALIDERDAPLGLSRYVDGWYSFSQVNVCNDPNITSQKPTYAVVKTDLDGSIRTDYFDGAWRIVRSVGFAPGATRQEYNYTNGFLTGIADGTGKTTCITNDTAGKPVQILETGAPNRPGGAVSRSVTLTYDAAEQLVQVVEGGRGTRFIRDPDERVIAEGHQVDATTVNWTCYDYVDTLKPPIGVITSPDAGTDGGPVQSPPPPPGQNKPIVSPPPPRPVGSDSVVAGRPRVGSFAEGVAAGTMAKSPPPVCPSWGCNGPPPPMFVPSGCATALSVSPHVGDFRYLQATTPTTVRRHDGSRVMHSGIVVGGPSDVAMTDTDGVSVLREEYVDYDPYGRPAKRGRVAASMRVQGSGVATTYDPTSGRLMSTTAELVGGGTATTTYSYDKSLHLHLVTSPTMTRQIDSDALGHVYRVIDTPATGFTPTTAPRTSCFNVDVAGRLHDAIRPEGDAVHYDYDAERAHVIAESRGALGTYGAWANGCVQIAPAAMETFVKYSFEPATGLPATVTRDGRMTRLRVDGLGRVVDEVTFAHATPLIDWGHPGGPVQVGYIEYDVHHWRTYDENDDVIVEASYDTVYDTKTPDVDFVVPATPMPLQHAVSLYAYDRLGRLTKSTAYNFTELPIPDGGVVPGQPGFNTPGNLIETIQYNDAVGHVTKVDADGHVTIEVFDALGRRRDLTTGAGSASQIDEGHTWSVTGTTLALDTDVVTRTPAPTSAGTIARTMVLDAHGLVRQILEADRAIATVDYDARDNPKTRTTPDRGHESFDVDAFGRIVGHTFVDAGNAKSVTSWDRDDRPNGRTDAANHATSMTYDAQGRLVTETNAIGTTRHAYVPGRNVLSSSTDPAGTVVSYQYALAATPTGGHGEQFGDARLSTRTTLVGGRAERTLTYAWTSQNRLASVQLDNLGKWTFAYDSLGRTVQEVSPLTGITVGRSYGVDAQSTVLTAGSTTGTIARTFDAQHRVSQVSYNGANVATLDYAKGAFDGITYANGVAQSRAYDDRARPTQTTAVFGSTVAAGMTYGLGTDNAPRVRSRRVGNAISTDLFQADALGRVTGEDLGFVGTPPNLGTGTRGTNVRDYSNADVASAWSTGVRNSGFVLDGASNWTARTGTSAFTPTIDAANRYTAIDSDPVGFDNAGATAVYKSEIYKFSGDAFLTSAAVGGTTTTFVTDPLGRRASETSGGHTTYYVWDGATLVALLPDNDASRAQIRVGAGADDTLALIDAFGAGAKHYVHAGLDGSAMAVTNASGVVEEAYWYSAYGETTIMDGRGAVLGASQIGNRFLYQGALYDPALVSYSMRAREYKPAWGRFLSPDPAGIAFGDNRYAFVDGRPLTMRDPSGLCAQTNDGSWTNGVKTALKAVDLVRRAASLARGPSLAGGLGAIGGLSILPDGVARAIWGAADKAAYFAMGGKSSLLGRFVFATGAWKAVGGFTSGVGAFVDAKARGMDNVASTADGVVAGGVTAYGVASSPIDTAINLANGAVGLVSPAAAKYTGVIAAATPTQSVKMGLVGLIDTTDNVARLVSGDADPLLKQQNNELAGKYNEVIRGYAILADALGASLTNDTRASSTLQDQAASGFLGPLGKLGDSLGDLAGWIEFNYRAGSHELPAALR